MLPAAATDVLLKTNWWAGQQIGVATWTVGLCLVLGLVTWQLRAATAGAAATGAILAASLMFSTLQFPYKPWNTALVPVLAVALLAYATTYIGHAQKERLGTGEKRNGRAAAQIAANLGAAALVAGEFTRAWLEDAHGLARLTPEQAPLFVAALAALAEAAADTVSSELGQVFGGRPRMLTTLRIAAPGTDGAISPLGTIAGIIAAAIVSWAGTAALRGSGTMLAVSLGGAVFGLLFDSLLGATLENAGWLNNDAVNFLSSSSAAGLALMVLAFVH